jgi:hypothetical protein
MLASDEAVSNPKLPPIDLVAMISQVETLNLAIEIDIEGDAVREERPLTETTLSAQMVVGHWQLGHWESYWSDRVGLRRQCITSAPRSPPSNGRRVTHHWQKDYSRSTT